MKLHGSMRGAAATAIIAAVLLVGCGANTPEAKIASAKHYLAKDDPKAAVVELRNALQKNPDLAEARFLLGKTQLESGDVVAAERELRKAIELKYPPDEAIPPLAEAMLQQGQFKKLVDEFRKSVLTSADSRAELQTVLANAQLALGNKDAAANAFAAATAAKDAYPPAMLGQARLKASASDLPGALALVDAALVKSPKLAEGWLFKGDILLAQGKAVDAMAAYGKAVEAKPDDLAAHATIAWVSLQQGKVDAAAAEVAAMKRVAPKHPQTLYLEAVIAYRQGDFVAAREAIQQELKAAPSDLQGTLLAGAIAYQLKSYEEAESATLKVLQASRSQLFARRILVATYLSKARPAKALEALTPVLDRIDLDSKMLALAGEVYIRNGDATKAAKYFERSAALDPRDPAKRTAAALTRLAKGEAGPAFQELEQAAALDTGIRSDLALIAAHLTRREFDQALAAIDALAKKEPNSPIAPNLRGVVLLGQGDSAGARQSFERALELDPTYTTAAANLARLDLADKKPEMARKRFEAVLAKDPKNVQALLAIAELSVRTGTKGETVAAPIRKAIAADPVAPAPRLALIAFYLNSKDPKKAVAAGQDAVAALPDNAEVLEALGQAQLIAGDDNQALATFNKLVSLRPDSPIPYMHLAEVQTSLKNYAAALESLNKALAIKPDLVEAQRRIIALLVGTRQIQQALALAREVQKQPPNESVGFAMEGDIYGSQKEWRSAIAAYRAGLKQVPTDSDLAVKLHEALVASADPGAAKFAASWRKEHPKDIVFLRHLAVQAVVRKDFASALEAYRTLDELIPNNAALLNNLAGVAWQAKDPKALEYAERANALVPNEPAFMDTLGALLIDNGDTARGLELLQKASSMAPFAPFIRFNLANALIKAGQKDAAKRELDELAKLGDKFPAQAEVTRLKQEL
jgi:cellulose synthase operon protein C